MLALAQSQHTPRHQYHLHPSSQQQQQPLPYNSQLNSLAATQNWVAGFSSPQTPISPEFSFNNSPNYVPSEQSSVYDISASSEQNLYNLRISSPYREPELMQSDHTVAPSWNLYGQLTPTSARSHYRESSLSSLGSAGPASPYTNSTSHPQVIQPPDSVHEAYYDGLPLSDHSLGYQNFSKPLTPHTPNHDSTYTTPLQQYSSHDFNDSHYGQVMAMQKSHTSGDDESMPAPDYAHSARPSVASTHESPATPAGAEDFDDSSRKPDFRNSSSSVPKLDRTMSDAYNDELYNPNIVFTSAPSSNPVESKIAFHNPSDVFSQRLQAANSQHLSTQSPMIDQARGRSPFRQGSPLAPTSNGFNSPQALVSAARLREMRKAENDARALQEQLQRRSPTQSTPKTISPKDALLDYHEAEEDASMPLFPQSNAHQYQLQSQSQQRAQPVAEKLSVPQNVARRESSASFAAPSQSAFTFTTPALPHALNIPQQYPFVPQRRQASNLSNMSDRAPEFPPSLASMESSSSEYTGEELKKPAGANADSGTYTCTYHGCSLRFESPAKLQKHKREGHRQSAPLIGNVQSGNGSAHTESGGMTSAALLRNSQAGPHKCDRINPSTGKPCNTIFSRPYDLTRHEDTIHNARKQKVRCHICTEEKTFSRNDALTRHMRVVHPEVEFPGKIRRRGHE